MQVVRFKQDCVVEREAGIGNAHSSLEAVRRIVDNRGPCAAGARDPLDVMDDRNPGGGGRGSDMLSILERISILDGGDLVYSPRLATSLPCDAMRCAAIAMPRLWGFSSKIGPSIRFSVTETRRNCETCSGQTAWP